MFGLAVVSAFSMVVRFHHSPALHPDSSPISISLSVSPSSYHAQTLVLPNKLQVLLFSGKLVSVFSLCLCAGGHSISSTVYSMYPYFSFRINRLFTLIPLSILLPYFSSPYQPSGGLSLSLVFPLSLSLSLDGSPFLWVRFLVRLPPS